MVLCNYFKVKPLGKTGKNNWGGMGVTLVDSLDTLWLMGLTDEFYNGRWEICLTRVHDTATLEDVCAIELLNKDRGFVNISRA